MIKLALIYGGRSAERDVSISGAKEIEKALDKGKYLVRKYDPATDLSRLIKDATEIDCAFILLHGKYGEDGTVQGLLDLLDIPYQSSGVLGSAMSMDKHISKIVYQRAGLLTPAWVHLKKGEGFNVEKIVQEVGLPAIVKPCNQGSSVGISIVKDIDFLKKAILTAFDWDDYVIVEEFLKGREITGGVLGLDSLLCLPIVEIIPGEGYEFFDYEAKYKPGATKEICPAQIPEDIFLSAQKIAQKAHRALKLEVYSRTDMIFTNDKKIYVIETNTIPGMTPTSLFPQAAEAIGISFPELLDRLIELALEKNTQESSRTH